MIGFQAQIDKYLLCLSLLILTAIILPVGEARAETFQVSGEAGGAFRYDYRDLDNGYAELIGYESFLRAGLASYIWDPRFLTYRGWGRIFWRDLSSNSPQAMGATAYTSAYVYPEQQVLDTDYDVRISMFQRRPYRLDLFAMRNNRQLSIAQLPPYDTVVQAYGGDTRISAGGFSIIAGGQYRDIEFNDLLDNRHEQTTDAHANVARKTDTQNFLARYQYLDRIDLENGFDYRENSIYVNEDIRPGKTTFFYLQGSLRNTELGAGGNSVTTNTYTLSPAFVWRPDEWSIYDLRSDFIYSEIVGSSRLSSGAFAGRVLRQMKRGLWVRYGVGGLYLQTEQQATGDTSQRTGESAFAGVQYTRLIRYYRATVDFQSTGGANQNQPGEDGLYQSHTGALVIIDPHLEHVIWYTEFNATYIRDESSSGIDVLTYQGRLTVRNKKSRELLYWTEVGYINDTRYLPNETFYNQSAYGNGSISYLVYPGQIVRGFYGYTYRIEPITQSIHTADLTYSLKVLRSLNGRVGGRYYGVDPETSEGVNAVYGLCELSYRIRSLVFLAQYSYGYRESGEESRYTEHAVYFEAKREFRSMFAVGEPKR